MILGTLLGCFFVKTEMRYSHLIQIDQKMLMIRFSVLLLLVIWAFFLAASVVFTFLENAKVHRT